MSITIIIIDGKQIEELMSKVNDLANAVGTLTAKVDDAVTLLNAGAAAPVDDPAIQPLIDQVTASAQKIDAAVTAYRTAHPSA